MTKKKSFFGGAARALVAALGPSLGDQLAAGRPAVDTPSPQAARVARDQAAAHWAGRLAEAETRAATLAWERAVQNDASDAASWSMLARARFFLADGFLILRQETGDAAAARELVATHEAGAAAAEAGLRATSPELARRRAQGVPIADAIAGLDAAAMPLAFWWAQNTILWASARGLTALLRYHQPVFQVMERVAALAPETWYGGPDRYFGTVFAAAPAFAGGDLQKGRRHFEQSLARAPDLIDTYALYAQLYARPAKDDALYQQLVARALATPVDVIPELVPEQTIAKQKAQKLLGSAR